MADDTFSAIVAEIAQALAPLGGCVASAESAGQFLATLGWELPPGVSDIGLVGTDVSGLVDATLTLIRSTDAEWDDAALIAERVGGVLQELAKVIQAVTAVMTGLQARTALPADYLAKTHMDTELLPRLLDFLVVTYLERRYYLPYQLLKLAGIISVELVDADPASYQTAHTRRRLLFDPLNALLAPGGQWAKDVYGWGTPQQDIPTFMASLADLLTALGASLVPSFLPRPLEEAVAGHAVPEADTDPMPSTTLTLLQGTAPDTYRMGVILFELRPSAATAADAGLAVLPFLSGTDAVSFPLPTTSARWFVVLDVAADLAGGVVMSWRPGTGTQVQTDVFGGTAKPLASGSVGLFVQYTVPDGGNAVLFALPDGTSLTLQGLKAGGGAHLAPAGGIDGFGQFALQGGTLTISLGSADSFAGSLIPARSLAVDASLTVLYSQKSGLAISGGAGLAAAIPVNASVGPFRIDTLHIALSLGADGVTLEASLDGTGSLGPVTTALQRIGAVIDLRFQDGNLGPLQLDVGFKPPTGAGLAIQAPAVSGGGFLMFDPGADQYAGVFDLTLIGTVSVKAIAIITTKMPDGSPGFALLILITAEGFTPVQLGLGFSLTGIGGLLALNHTVDADAVRGGLSSGVLDSVLFVKDPVKNASRVLTTLNHIFPVAADRLLIGPLAEISWGTPPLVTIRLALLLEVPQPIRVVLLAALSMMLPSPQDAVVEIHIDSIGVLDLGQRELALDASLHDSRMVEFTLTGDMALRLNWGDSPAFLLSMGGFHPRFTPPKGLRPLNRLALNLSSGDNPRVRFEAYLALTSNTIQMGARVDVHAEEAPFALDGGGSFDALIQWSPFALDVAFAAWVKITSGGSTLLAASVALEVTGPRPWHLTGQASVQVLAFTVTVGVDFTIGAAPSTPEVTESVDVAAEIWGQLSDPARWTTTLPAAVTPGVTLAGLPAASDTAPLVAHPLATITVQEQVAPLGTPIERVGGRLPVDGTRSYTASVSGPAGVAAGAVAELFAPGQYANLNDDERLAGPSFTPMTGGVSLTSQTAAAAGPALYCDLAVQTLDVTSLDAPATPGDWVAATADTARSPAVPTSAQTGLVTT